MTNPSRFARIAIFFACTSIPALSQTAVYIRSNAGQPWEQSTNEAAMDAVFGSGNWTTQYFETLSASSTFSSGTSFIFIEGGDSSFAGFQTFMESYTNSIYTWVHSGGKLVIMCAPNDPLTSSTVALPDNVILRADAFYGSAASSAYALDITNSIFNGPYSTAYSFSGDFVSHGYFSGGSAVVNLMESNLNEIILGVDTIGTGVMVFGGLTTDNFQSPQPGAHGLVENLISYAANY